jgi:hypothetical protein
VRKNFIGLLIKGGFCGHPQLAHKIPIACIWEAFKRLPFILGAYLWRVWDTLQLKPMPKIERAKKEQDKDRPRSMREEEVRERRKRMLGEPHIKPLSEYAAKLRTRGDVPDFDPLDGGIDARVLFLFEKPGPMTSQRAGRERSGSGFISRNNDDPTAEATFRFMEQARIPRKVTVTWNLVPWWNGTRSVTLRELQEGQECLRELMKLLPRLRAVVMVGGKALRAKPYLETTDQTLFSSAHPSPLVKARFPKRWNAIPLEWARVLSVLKT